jgi:acetoin utilization deacetylase AcuC-like enzyme
MPARSGDADWLAAFEGRVLPALDAFAPAFVLVSAGFDAHERDPLSSTLLHEASYARMTTGLLELAARHAGGKLVSLLEGGYDLEGLAGSAAAHVSALVGAAT